MDIDKLCSHFILKKYLNEGILRIRTTLQKNR